MTVISKVNGIIQKTTIIKPKPYVKNKKRLSNKREENIDMPLDFYKRRRRASLAGLCSVLVCTLVIIFCASLIGYVLYQMKPATHRYQGFCFVMGPREVEVRFNPRFRGPLVLASELDVQVFNILKDETGGDFVNSLREELDLGDTMEKISVYDNGHTVSFIHDFTENKTGIIDDDRCFITDLDQETVLAPNLFISGLENGGDFDVSHVRSNMRAELPALQAITQIALDLATKCGPRPIYRLSVNDSAGIRKRSADEPKHDYIQFSGKHVLEIKIDNLPEIIEYEKQNKTLIDTV